MNKNEIIKLIKITTGSAAGNLAKYFYNHLTDLSLVKELTYFLPPDATLIDRFYYIRHDLKAIKHCKYCDKELVTNLKSDFCSAKCNINFQIENTDIVKRRTENRIINYNNKSDEEKSLIRKNAKIKTQSTNLKRYGVTNNLHASGIKGKKIQTWQKNYGVDNPNKAKLVRDKIKNTNNDRYGGDTPWHNEKQNNLRKDTWQKKYGVDNPAKSKEIIDKTATAYLKKTGYKTPMHNPEVVNKVRATFMDNEGKGKHNKAYRYKVYNFSSGKQILIQGYESGALDNYLLNIYNENEIENNIKIINTFNFTYGISSSNIPRHYTPDFYIKKDNLFIEVKSLYFYNKNLASIFLKAKSVIDKGYNFYLLISNDNKKFKKITYEEIKTDFEKRNQ
jgi:hypothetical protein